MPFPCRFKDRFTHTMPFLCRDPSTTLPFSDSAVSHWPLHEIGMLLITNFLELGVASRQHAVTLPPQPCHGLERSFSERHIRGMAWHGMCE
jgi:hypothetical protein